MNDARAQDLWVGPDRSAALRQAVLMAAVLDDVDVRPDDAGVVLLGTPALSIPWPALDAAVGHHDPVAATGRERLVRWLRLARALGDLPLGQFRSRLRPVALPPGHALHPGPDWVRSRIPGGVLDVGYGLSGLEASDPDAVVVAPPALLESAGVDLDESWPGTFSYVDDMGAVAAVRYTRQPDAALHPMGDCDVLTLLASPLLRGTLAGADGVGMRGIACPMRNRGWMDPDHLDSAFAPAAAAATSAEQRGIERPVVVTLDGVHHVPEGVDPISFALRDPIPVGRHRGLRDVRYRST